MHHGFNKIMETVAYYFVPLSVCYAGTMIIISFVTHFINVGDKLLFNAIQGTDLNGFFLLTGSVIGSIGIRSRDKRPVGGALFCAFLLVFSAIVLQMVPLGIQFKALENPVQHLIGWMFILCPAAMIGVVYFCMAAVFHAQLDSSPGPTSKTDDAPPVPVPSDLAQDLRLSRSCARRSRAER